MNKMTGLAVICAAGLMLFAGCSKKEKTIAGAAIGAGSGALIGSAVGGTGGGLAGAAIGGLAGGLIGNSAGSSSRRAK